MRESINMFFMSDNGKSVNTRVKMMFLYTWNTQVVVLERSIGQGATQIFITIHDPVERA